MSSETKLNVKHDCDISLTTVALFILPRLVG